MGDCHGAERIDHFIYKCMVKKAGQEVSSTLPKHKTCEVKLEEKLGNSLIGNYDKRSADAVIHWYGFRDHSWTKTYIEIQREMEDQEFNEKITFYKDSGWDYDIIDLSKLPHTKLDDAEWGNVKLEEILEMDFQYIKAIVEGHIPYKIKGGK